ncbi:uncharacterized protein LOC142226843 isoform X1 [Haematobia irritans]|uniref:uncharacterized protein LOC142226843 isoform X1 n=1 Tax=Haematobia irritans TaxID=7368 RepID=UPI003F5053E4
MDIFNIPKKVNRHVLKAVYALSKGSRQKRIPFDHIIAEMEYQMRNLVPVRDFESVARASLNNLSSYGLIKKFGNEHYGNVILSCNDGNEFEEVNLKRKGYDSDNSLSGNEFQRTRKRFRSNHKKLDRTGKHVSFPKYKQASLEIHQEDISDEASESDDDMIEPNVLMSSNNTSQINEEVHLFASDDPISHNNELPPTALVQSVVTIISEPMETSNQTTHPLKLDGRLIDNTSIMDTNEITQANMVKAQSDVAISNSPNDALEINQKPSKNGSDNTISSANFENANIPPNNVSIEHNQESTHISCLSNDTLGKSTETQNTACPNNVRVMMIRPSKENSKNEDMPNVKPSLSRIFASLPDVPVFEPIDSIHQPIDNQESCSNTNSKPNEDNKTPSNDEPINSDPPKKESTDDTKQDKIEENATNDSKIASSILNYMDER